MKAIPLLASLCLLLGCNGINAPVEQTDPAQAEWVTDLCPDAKEPAQQVSVADLVADPSRYNGKVISVDAYFYSHFEHSAIYSTEETEPYSHKFSDGLWVQGISPISDASGRHLKLTGTFSSKDHGHLGQWPGTICVSSAKAIAPGKA